MSTNNSISIDLSAGFFTGNTKRIVLRDERGLVVMFINDAKIEFRTPAAHKAGFALVKKASQALPGEFVVMNINGQDIELPPAQAKKIGVSMLRRSDSADDYQLNRGR